VDTPPFTQPPPQTVEGLLKDTLKDYQEEVVDEGPLKPDPSREVGEWEEHDLGDMDATLNSLLYQTCPFHPHQYIHRMNPQAEFGSLSYKCPQEGCPVLFSDDTQQVILDKLKYETHPQVRNRLQRGSLKCKCGFTPRVKLSRTAKNYNKVFLSCGQFNPAQQPCGYLQWLHGPLWQPREQAQPTLRSWVKETPYGNVPLTPRL